MLSKKRKGRKENLKKKNAVAVDLLLKDTNVNIQLVSNLATFRDALLNQKKKKFDIYNNLRHYISFYYLIIFNLMQNIDNK